MFLGNRYRPLLREIKPSKKAQAKFYAAIIKEFKKS
jgi:hypothetical protein